MKTSDRIRNLRRRLGWSRADLARRMDCKPEIVVSWEEDRVLPNVQEERFLNLLENQAEFCSLGVRRHSLADRMLVGNLRIDQVQFSEVFE